MASIQSLVSKRDSHRYYRVKWQEGGRRGGRWDSESIDALSEAKRFKALVDANCNHRPTLAQLLAHGFGYLIPGGSGDPSGPVEVPDTVAAPVVPSPAGSPVVEAPAGVGVTFEEFAREYVDRLVRPNRESKRKYLERLVNNVFPVLGARPIAEITRREMRQWQNGLVHQGLSAKTIANIRGETVVPIFEAACLPGEDDEPPLRSYNPMKGLALPEYVKPERDIVETGAEARILVAAAYEVDPEAAELVVTMLATGMRWGEIAGLPVRAVHVERGTVSIQQVLRREHHVWVVVPKPKTRKGYRQIPVPDQVMVILRRRCAGRGRNEFVFTAPRGNFWRYAQFYDGRWKKIRSLAERNGIDKHLTPHGLRHSLLTLLATEGVDLEALRQIAGHRSISTTYDLYVHSNRKHHAAVRAVVAPFVGGDERDQASTT